ncbi:protein 4.1 isoform X3 [Lepisosteus oculatus]|uniref:protein 4.1 isoform X3 n=1 Tax=Lepisosteus oculatus TaxID=7918 RepID=UPI0035F515D9
MLFLSPACAMTTEASVVGEAESQQQPQEPEAAQDPGPSESQNPPQEEPPSSPPEEQLKPRSRSSAGRGLSRLFSSFLKRRSQCSEGDGPEAEKGDKEKKEKEREQEAQPAGPEEEVFLKAPIAAPEPELRAEGDPALDLHSLSSAETQPAQEDQENKEDPDTEKDSEEEEGGAEEEEEEEEEEEGAEQAEEGKAGGEAEIKAPEEPRAPKAPRKPRSMHCRVTLLDDTLYECELEKHAKGQDLFNKVCDHLNLLEKDYYGLAIWETPTQKTWMDVTKEIRKQVQGTSYDFTFNVKFYPPDPAQLTEDITRYYLCLQLRKDILSGTLPCSFVTLALLGSYTVQSELGEYDPELHGADYVSEVRLAPNQTKELEEKVMELHRTYRSMSPAQADMMFLENAKKLSMYGVDLHQAKDLEGVDITLGVCSSGLLVYKDKLRINRFPWPKVLKISYKRSSFFIKIRPSEQEQYESTIGFKLPNYRAAKKLWKVCVEHHTFFRLTSTEATTPRRFLALGSKFRYSGRTQAQTRQASSMIDRPAPQFQRTASKRASRSLDGAGGKSPHAELNPVEERKEEDDWFVLMDPNQSQLNPEPSAAGEATPAPPKPAVDQEEKEDDWFVLLDRAASQHTPEPPAGGSVAQPRPTAASAREWQDDWFVLLDTTPSSPAVVPTPDKSTRPVSAPVISPVPRGGEPSLPAPASAAPPADQRELPPAAPQPPKEEQRTAEVKSEAPASEPSRPEPTQEVKVGRERREGPAVTASNGEKAQKRAKKIEGETIYIRHSNLMLEDLDKTQDEIMRHHASISELKRNFMESVPEPRPSEWEKRLSTHSPFRALGINGQAQPGSDGNLCGIPDNEPLDIVALREDNGPDITREGGALLSSSSGGRASCAVDEGVESCHEEEELGGEGLLEQAEPEVIPEEQAAQTIQSTEPHDLRKCGTPCVCGGSEEDPAAEASQPFEVEGASLASYYVCENRPFLIRCFQPPLVKTQTVTISDVSNSVRSDFSTKEVPIVHTETKTITYEAAQLEGSPADRDPGVLLSAQTITSETIGTTTTTQITKTVKGGISETRIEKRIVITGDADIDHDQALAQAIKEAKEQHPDMSVTKVVVHQETEITPE